MHDEDGGEDLHKQQVFLLSQFRKITVSTLRFFFLYFDFFLCFCNSGRRSFIHYRKVLLNDNY